MKGRRHLHSPRWQQHTVRVLRYALALRKPRVFGAVLWCAVAIWSRNADVAASTGLRSALRSFT